MTGIIFFVAVLNLVLGYGLAVYLKHGALPKLKLPSGGPQAAAPLAETPVAGSH